MRGGLKNNSNYSLVAIATTNEFDKGSATTTSSDKVKHSQKLDELRLAKYFIRFDVELEVE